MVKIIALVVCLGILWGFSRKQENLHYLALGDSYTIGQSVDVNDRYPVQAVDRLRAGGKRYEEPDIIAVTGWTTGDLLAAMPAAAPKKPYDAVSLLIGVNNQYRGLGQAQYREQFRSLLEQAIRQAGGRPSKVIVLSIPDYSVTPFARRGDIAYIGAQIDSFNSINHQVSMELGAHYINITEESRKAASDPTLIAGDSLHFSGREYAIWAKLMEPVMKGM